MKIGARNQIKGTSRPSRKAARPSPSSRRPTSWSLSTSDSSARARCARRLESLKPLWVGALLLLGDFCLFIWDSHSLWSPCPATRVSPLPHPATRVARLALVDDGPRSPLRSPRLRRSRRGRTLFPQSCESPAQTVRCAGSSRRRCRAIRFAGGRRRGRAAPSPNARRRSPRRRIPSRRAPRSLAFRDLFSGERVAVEHNPPLRLVSNRDNSTLRIK